MLKLQTDKTKLREKVEYFSEEDIKVLIDAEKVLADRSIVSLLKYTSKEMIDFLLTTKSGVGLAAPQVGFHIPIILVCEDSKQKNVKVYVNPVVTPENDKTNIEDESCLSFPDISAIKVQRYTTVRLDAYEYKNNKLFPVSKIYTKMNARIVQHEVDHLNGLEMFDRSVSPITGKLHDLLEKFKNIPVILKREDTIFVNEEPYVDLYTGETIDFTDRLEENYQLVGIKYKF